MPGVCRKIPIFLWRARACIGLVVMIYNPSIYSVTLQIRLLISTACEYEP